MSKRAIAFKRNDREFYPTPRAAVLPLVPFLQRDGVRTFVEPCYGGGDLARHLESFGLKCVDHGDIESGWDARNWREVDFLQADASITNPPWDRERVLMAEIMRHHAQFVPGWFLVPSDWFFTRRASLLVAEFCTDIVPIGRMKIFPDSDSSGFDNCAWARLWKGKDTGAAQLWPMGPEVVVRR